MDSDSFSISVSVPLDDDGYYDRRCPSPVCNQPFKVLFEDWKEKVADDAAYCPFCRYQSEAQDYNTNEQNEYFRAMAMAEAQRQLGQMLSGMARGFN